MIKSKSSILVILIICSFFVFSCKSTTESPRSYQLVTSVEPDGSGTVQPSEPTTHEEGTMVTMTATPNVNWVFDHWSGDITSTDNPAEIEINEPKNIIANFVPEQFPLIIIINGNGTVQKTVYKQKTTNDTTYHDYDTLIYFTATPDDGWVFDRWGNAMTGNANPDGFRLDKAKTLWVYFKELYAVDYEVIGNGSVSLNLEQDQYINGTSIQVTATPETGWSFDHWEGDIIGNQNPHTLIINSDKSFKAVFTQDNYTISVNVAGNGVVTVDPLQDTYLYPTEVTFTATPDPSYFLTTWGNYFNPSLNEITINISENISISAIFDLILNYFRGEYKWTIWMGSQVYGLELNLYNNSPVSVLVNRLLVVKGGTTTILDVNYGGYLLNPGEVLGAGGYTILETEAKANGMSDWTTTWYFTFQGQDLEIVH